ncbi:hypothetical protein PQX77_002910 [Marasmius sp. AFHP31]|nr:hypothetical protein PQX77_002910 [Marasmius sp. AFHP31]
MGTQAPLEDAPQSHLTEEWSRRPLTQAEKAVVEQHLLDGERDLRRYEAELNRLKASIMVVEGKRDRTRKALESYRSLLAPVQQMPSEILNEIFSNFCSSHDILLPPDSDTLPSPVALSMVCGRWRDICLSSTGLWSFITIYTSHWDEGLRMQWLLKLVLDLFMERSKGHQLHASLCIDHTTPPDGGFMDIVDVALGTLERHSHRWSDMEFDLNHTAMQHPVFSRVGNLSMLHTFTLRTYGLGTGKDLRLIRSASALRHLSLSLFGIPINVDDVPWAQLEELELVLGEEAPSPLEIVVLCHNLRQLKLRDRESDSNQSRRHIASDLTSLIICAPNSLFLDHATLPKLSSFDVSFQRYEPHSKWDPVPFRNMLLRSQCSVTSFSLSNADITDIEVISLLRIMPTLNCVHVHERRPSLWEEPQPVLYNKILTPTFFNQLIVHESAGTSLKRTSVPLVPRLHELGLDIHCHDFDGVAFSKVIASRWIPESDEREMLGVDGLRSVEVRFIDEVVELPESLVALRCFTDVGLRVSIEHPDFWRSD